MPKAKVLTVGIAVVDYVFQTDELPVSAEKHFATGRFDVVGGIAVNAALAIQSLGGQASLWSRVGDDQAAGFITKTLEKAGVDLSVLEPFEGQNSASSAVVIDASGERMIVNYRSDELFELSPSLSSSSIRETGAVLGDLRWIEATEAAFKAARVARVPTVLDFDLTSIEAPNALLEGSDYIIFAEAALKRFARSSNVVSSLKAVRERLPNTRLAVTCGGNGVHLINGDGRQLHIPARSVVVRSTLGAGDVFHGAFALAIAEGHGFEAALRFANDVSALKVSSPPDQASFPTRADVDNFQRTTA